MIDNCAFQALLEYHAARFPSHIIENVYRDFNRITFHNGHYISGYPCDPCPNCNNETMWYSQTTWWYDAQQNIVHGMHCERCNHTWKPETGEIYWQGMTQTEFKAYWHYSLINEKGG